MPHFSRRFRRWIAFFIWFTGILMITGLGIWNFIESRKDADNRLVMEAGHTAAQLAGLVSIPEFDMDYMATNAIIDAAMENEQLYAIKIETGNGYIEGQRRNYLWEPVPWDNEIAENCIQGMNLIKKDGKVLGKVEVWLSPRMNAEEETLLAKREVFRIGLTSIIWSAGFMLLLWYVGDFRKLRRFLSHAKKIEFDNGASEGIINSLNTENNAAEKDSESKPVHKESEARIVDAELARQYQRKERDAWFVTSGMFRQTFAKAPALINKLYSQGEYAGLSHLGRILEQAAPSVGAKILQEKARMMQGALNNPENENIGTSVEECFRALVQVLTALDGSAKIKNYGNERS